MSIITKMPIYNIFIVACILTGICLIALIFTICFTRKITKLANTQHKENKAISVTSVKITDTHKFDKPLKIFRITTIITASLSILTMSTYLYFNHKALKYGAHDGYMHIESISSINKNAKYGFIESDNIPDDLTGCIIIYFKYGCNDCARIHDALIKSLNDNNVKNYYFVSSQSEIGKKLRQTYPIDAVPTGIYVRKDKDANVGHYTKVLYDITADSDATNIFVEDNLLYLINAQKDGE